MYDVAFPDAPANARPSVFSKILQPTVNASSNSRASSNTAADKEDKDGNASSSDCNAASNPLQMELHFRSSKDATRCTVLLNNMRLMGVFDWLLAVKDFLLTNVDDPWKNREQEIQQGEKEKRRRGMGRRKLG